MTTQKKSVAGSSSRHILHKLKMLCDCGAGIGAIAGPVCAAARQLVDGDNGGLFWLDEERRPAGFYHETPRADLKDLFITRFDELFSGPGQQNMLTWTETDGPSIGKALDPEVEKEFRAGNVYKYLCEPLDHHFVIDLRVEVNGIGRVLLMVWHKGQRPFTAADIETLRPVQAMLTSAFHNERSDARWVRCGSGNAHFIADMTGTQLLAIDAEAEALLMNSHLLTQNVPMLSKPRTAPAFSLILAGMLEAGAPVRHEIAIANGRILASARPTQMLDGQGGEATNMFVSLAHEVSFDVLCIEHLAALPLSPLQMELALFGMQGGDRADCMTRFGVSAEAMKKHSARIFDVLGVGRWLDLPQIAERIAAETAARD